MSSDDSEGDVHAKGRRLCLRTLPWRNPAITEWLHSIDCLPPSQAEALRERDRPRIERLRGDGVTSRAPLPRLPRPLYSETWLHQQGEVSIARLQISTAMIQLPAFQTFATRPTEYASQHFLLFFSDCYPT